MPSAVSPNPRAASAQPDELDRLLDIDNAVEDFLNDKPVRNGGQDATLADQLPRDEDQEVQIKKKRAPVPKLDENRLLSDAGIPKLRKVTRKSLKFRGKGHEFSDISRLLNTYQLWLDDLYPRAKFKDALAMVEKVGHSKRMQVSRRAWLDETKPNRGLSPDPDVQMSGANGNRDDDPVVGGDEQRYGDINAETASGQRSTSEAHENNAEAAPDDELDTLMAENYTTTTAPQKRNGPFEEDDGPDEDELDVLLAERNQSTSGGPATRPSRNGPAIEPSDDELDALMTEQTAARPPPTQAGASMPEQPPDDFADDEEAMAEMEW